VDWAAMSSSRPFSSSTSLNLIKGANDRISNPLVLRFKATSLSKSDTGLSFLLSLITIWDKTKQRREEKKAIPDKWCSCSCLFLFTYHLCNALFLTRLIILDKTAKSAL